jgi:hypothetical protein
MLSTSGIVEVMEQQPFNDTKQADYGRYKRQEIHDRNQTSSNPNDQDVKRHIQKCPAFNEFLKIILEIFGTPTQQNPVQKNPITYFTLIHIISQAILLLQVHY